MAERKPRPSDRLANSFRSSVFGRYLSQRPSLGGAICSVGPRSPASVSSPGGRTLLARSHRGSRSGKSRTGSRMPNGSSCAPIPSRSQNLGAHSQLARDHPAVRGRHERWGGQGYPARLAAEAIPLGARVIAVIDSSNAMTTNRSYQGCTRAFMGASRDSALRRHTTRSAGGERVRAGAQRARRGGPGGVASICE
jgi:hypothetical protein